MKKLIRLDDLDIINQKKKLAKEIDKAMEKRCFLCNQVMQHLYDLTWYCKRCDTLTTVQSIVSFKNGTSNRIGFIEY